MKTYKIISICLLLLFNKLVYTQGVSINENGDSPDNSAILDVKSTSKGLLFPRLSNTQMFGIQNPAEGLQVYNTTVKSMCFYDGTNWKNLADNSTVSPPAISHPFPNHTTYTSGHIKPNNFTQSQLDQQTRTFYDSWKAEYLKNDCGGGLYYISSGSPHMTVSEAHGYGMMIMVIMAGYDTNAQTYFDGLCNYYDAHRSSINNDLMSWQQDNCSDPTHNDDAATDGDIDIAFALLTANAQWGSSGSINYLQKANTIIDAIKDDEIDDTDWHIKLGDWEGSSDHNTRTSDFIPDHFRAFQAATGDNNWNNIIDKCYDLIDDMQTNFSPSTGLLPDFISHLDGTPQPAAPDFLEGPHDGHYYYNACRDPWRIASDYLLNGENRAKNSVNKITNWLKTDCNNDISDISNGYKLDGTKIYTWNDPAFIAPFAVGAMVDATHQTWLNDLYTEIESSSVNDYDYFENTLKLLSMIVISGNYWKP